MRALESAILGMTLVGLVSVTLAAQPEPASAQTPESEPGSEEETEATDEGLPRRGIPVTEPLLHEHCGECHEVKEDNLMGRISYMRKTPEGWELSLKRMLRLYDVDLTPQQAREVVRYLANRHGLARSEAERALYEVERRVHWSEEKHDEELRETCGECHTLGRVFSERRDAHEWKLLKATHLAFFPLADRQAFRGPQPEVDWESLTDAERDEEIERRQRRPDRDRADRVLAELAKELPLFTDQWEAWQANRREVPVAGTWTVVGHEISRGDIVGQVTIHRVDQDTYRTEWDLQYEDGASVQRTGRGLLFAGYSWRGRSKTTASGEPPELREVLLLSDDWSRMKGRIFTGEYNELGADVTLYRHNGAAQILAVKNGALRIPSSGHDLELIGAAFPSEPQPEDFHLGEGVTITAAERISDQRVKLTLNVAREAERGGRIASFRAQRGPPGVVLYDTIDYIKVVPEEGLARVGGKMRPKQLERFEAVAMNRGQDDEPYTEDDYAIRVVPARWAIEEFPVRENDDDSQFVGTIDVNNGVFVPGLDGPNPSRRWRANNIGDVYVVATSTLTVPKRSEEEGGSDSSVIMEKREFRARGHLLVTVPIYVRWDLP